MRPHRFGAAVFSRFLRRYGLWVAVSAVAAVIAGLYAFSSPSFDGIDSTTVCPQPASTEAVAGPEKLITKFEHTVFRKGEDEVFDTGFVRKWTSSVRLRLHDVPERYRDYVQRLALTLSCLTGRHVYIFDSHPRLKPNFEVHIFSPDQLSAFVQEKWGISLGATDDIHDYFDCFVLPYIYVERHVIKKASAIILNDLSEAFTRRCFSEEITQGLGLLADSEVIERSVFRNEGPLIEELTLNDKILVRTLYDPRIRPGMKRDDAMEIVREIVPELVRAVRERGVEALYQR